MAGAPLANAPNDRSGGKIGRQMQGLSHRKCDPVLANLDLHIGPATFDDAKGIQEVVFRGWLTTYPNADHGITVGDIEERFKDRDSEERLVKTRAQIANPTSGETTLVARIGDTVVGVCVAMRYPDRNQVRAIYVLPNFQRRGIGQALWKAAQEFFDPAHETAVEVAIYNKSAIEFYEGLGFVDSGRRMRNPNFAMKSGAIIPEMEMRRQVGTG